MITTIPIATVTFPEIRLKQREATHLRGFFGNYFKEHSPLLHNHYDDGRLRYKYPLVQYKVLDGIPTLLGIQDGAKLLTDLFFQMQTIRIENQEYAVMERDISLRNEVIGIGTELYDYQFITPWMALNQDNYPEYKVKSPEERKAQLSRILTNHILSYFKGMSLFLPPEGRILVVLRPQGEKITGFKNQLMTGINADFTTNVLLPDFIGIGKSVSRGFGTIQKK